MRELGTESARIHRDLAVYIGEHLRGSPDTSLYLVGPLMRDHVAPLLSPHMSVVSSLSSREFGEKIRDLLSVESDKPTLIYVK